MKEKITAYVNARPALRRSIDYAMRHKILVIILAFLVWMTFFDRNSLILHAERERSIAALQDSIAYYKREIQRQRQYLNELKSDPKQMEKFARERAVRLQAIKNAGAFKPPRFLLLATCITRHKGSSHIKSV